METKELSLEELQLLYEESKKDKRSFRRLKNLAIRCQKYEIASHLREMESELFPDTDELKEAKEIAADLDVIFRMVGLKVNEPACWMIYQAVLKYQDKGKEFDLKMAIEIKSKVKYLFEYEEDN